jgi:hypothetical protein
MTVSSNASLIVIGRTMTEHSSEDAPTITA